MMPPLLRMMFHEENEFFAVVTEAADGADPFRDCQRADSICGSAASSAGVAGSGGRSDDN